MNFEKGIRISKFQREILSKLYEELNIHSCRLICTEFKFDLKKM